MLGLNLNQFKKDIASEKARQRIESDQERADSLGVRSTPTVFINNQEVAPNEKTPNGLRAKIDAALKQKSSKA